MSDRVLVDTGPLVALFSRRDEHHKRCHDELRSLRPPLLACWPVLTEAAWLLRKRPQSLQQLLKGFDEGLFALAILDEKAPRWIAAVLQRYEELAAQLADAALMYLAEREEIETIFTLDRRDFTVYRLSMGRSPKVLPALDN